MNDQEKVEHLYELATHGTKEDYIEFWNTFVLTGTPQYCVEILEKLERYIYEQNKYYVYMPTFTKDPKLTSNKTDDECYAFIKKTLTRPRISPVSLYISKEYHKSGKSHWHCCVKTKTKLTAHDFEGWKINYGLFDIGANKKQSRSLSDQENSILSYIQKHENAIKEI
jgi:hypothetical protein